MKQFKIFACESNCRKKEGGFDKCLLHDIKAFHHGDYQGGGNWRIPGTLENLICTFKNDVTPYSPGILRNAASNLLQILKTDLPEILRGTGYPSLRVCVVPRAKRESSYRPDQLYLRATIQHALKGVDGFEDGTHDIIRHSDTVTTHLAHKGGNGGNGEKPYIGITKDTCTISDNIINKDILLIDDLYTKTVNIDEDCIQALYDKGANNVFFYSIGKTLSRYQ